MAEQDDEDLGRSIGAVLVDPSGAILTSVTATDGESFYSFLHFIPDISLDLPDVEETEEAYAGNFWFTAMDRNAEGHLFVADDDGNVHSNRSGRWEVEQVTPEHGLRVVRCLADGTVIVTGLAGSVHRLTGAGWETIGTGFDLWINDISGASGSDLLAVGDSGLVAHFDGTRWTRTDLATNATLNAVLPHGGQVYICGAAGTLFRGQGDTWEDISSPGPDLFGLAVFQGNLWVACGGEGAGRLEGTTIVIQRDTFAAFEVHAAGKFIAFAGNDLVVRHDGKDWEGYGYG